MGLRSSYESGPDEEDIFRLVDPDFHPNTEDEEITQEEVAKLSASTYDESQEQFDEQESIPSPQELIERIHTLPPQKIADLWKYLQQG